LLVWLLEVTMQCYNVIPQSLLLEKKPSVSMNQAQKYTGPWQGSMWYFMSPCTIILRDLPVLYEICVLCSITTSLSHACFHDSAYISTANGVQLSN